ncbi:MAG: phospho-sugar mutase [Anaerovoracaceae bacterium]
MFRTKQKWYTKCMDKKQQIYKKIYEQYDNWLSQTELEPEIRDELLDIKNSPEKIAEAFHKELKFGTSGIRGIIGAGTNRMNVHVVEGITQGLSNYVNKNFVKPSVVICYDSRKNSRKFAEKAAEVLMGNGIDAFIFSEIATVSLLSYTIRKLHSSMGIIITASHNPKDYNGYKVYNQFGYQITGVDAKAILDETEKINVFNDIKRGKISPFDNETEIINSFIEEITKATTIDEILDKNILENLRIVYTPLNGAGNLFVRKAFESVGFSNVFLVDSQMEADENFTTCAIPNPEKIQTYEESLKVLKSKHGDIIIATDPDCDRVGVALIHNDQELLLTGNQLGILILDFLCTYGQPKKGQIVYRSIVSTPLIDKIAENYGLKVINTLTGFKYIGQNITQLESEGRIGDFFFGFEESNGYLVNPFVRDKDGVSSALIVCKMAAYYKAKGMDFVDRLNQIYKTYGNYSDWSFNYYFEGAKGQQKIKKIMDFFRTNVREKIGQSTVIEVLDYLGETGLPKEDVLEYHLNNEDKFIIRPSGTESKIKVYIFTYFDHKEIKKEIENIINIIE